MRSLVDQGQARVDQGLHRRDETRDARVWVNTTRTEERNMSTYAHNRPTDIDTRLRELAHRSNNGLDVTLYWHTETDELLVRVYDECRDVYFEIQPERDFALDVYYHPYAHVRHCDD